MSHSNCTCVRCPRGCVIGVEIHGESMPIVHGNACARGAEYAIAEITRPERILTMTIPIAGCLEPLSVKTALPIPKDAMPEVIRSIKNLRLTVPIVIGDILISDVCNLGVSVIATKSLP